MHTFQIKQITIYVDLDLEQVQYINYYVASTCVHTLFTWTIHQTITPFLPTYCCL